MEAVTWCRHKHKAWRSVANWGCEAITECCDPQSSDDNLDAKAKTAQSSASSVIITSSQHHLHPLPALFGLIAAITDNIEDLGWQLGTRPQGVRHMCLTRGDDPSRSHALSTGKLVPLVTVTKPVAGRGSETNSDEWPSPA